MRRNFRSWLGFVNYHIFFTGFVFTKNPDSSRWKHLRLRKVSAVFKGMKRDEIWKKDISFAEFEKAIMIIGPIAMSLDIDIHELLLLFKELNELHHAGLSGAAAGIQLRKELSRLLAAKETMDKNANRD
jgi:hypothetical protein